MSTGNVEQEMGRDMEQLDNEQAVENVISIVKKLYSPDSLLLEQLKNLQATQRKLIYKVEPKGGDED